jgi:hypothetical protein
MHVCRLLNAEKCSGVFATVIVYCMLNTSKTQNTLLVHVFSIKARNQEELLDLLGHRRCRRPFASVFLLLEDNVDGVTVVEALAPEESRPQL